jgi:pimeloyl-ACP methyl ester carboxylesterase
MIGIIKREYVWVMGGQLHFRQVGNGQFGISPPLILLHQTASSSAMYEAMMAILGEKFWCIAPDTFGFGNSTPNTDTPFSIADHSQALCELLTQLGIPSCYLFGHHTGAAIAVQVAHDRPDWVKKLILSGPPLLSQAQIESLKTTLPKSTLDPNGKHLAETWERIAKKDVNLPPELIQREVLLTLQAGEHYPQAYWAVFEQDFAGQLDTIGCPTLVVAGERDSLIGSLQFAYERLRYGEMVVVENAGTFLCDQQPEIMSQLITQFLQKE